jgi:hypothetical protein
MYSAYLARRFLRHLLFSTLLWPFCSFKSTLLCFDNAFISRCYLLIIFAEFLIFALGPFFRIAQNL